MTYRIEIDISCEDFEFNWKWLGSYINRGMRVVHYVHIGPAGGNPCVTMEFPDLALLTEFAEEYSPDVGETIEEFLETYGVK